MLRVDWLGAAGVVVAIAFGFAVRAWGVGSVGFNSDEAVYAGQAASLAGDPNYTPFFAIFRAHPLLVQFLLSLVFKVGVSDIAGRLLMVVVGLAAIPLIYLVGSELFSRRVGLLAALTLAVLPYHVTVTRQVLLDGPETTLFLLAMYLLARYVGTQAPRYLYVAAIAAGLTFLAKETGILILFVIGGFALMAPSMQLGWPALRAVGLFLVTVSPYPISIVISGASDTARQFLIWQLLRRPNHDYLFYGQVLPGAFGVVLLAIAVIGVVLAIREGTWRHRLLMAWVLIPLAFYQAWPVKGYQYLVPIAPAVILLGVSALEQVAHRSAELLERQLPHLDLARRFRAVFALLAAILLTSTAIPGVAGATSTGAQGSLAGTGGLPGGREAGIWIDANLPHGAEFMTIGPTMSNLVQFYGHRGSHGLSVSANPLHRNPAYDPVPNPDNAFRTLRVQYVAWDVWSAARSPHFSEQLLRYVSNYHGKLIYEERANVRQADGSVLQEAVIRIYEVRP